MPKLLVEKIEKETKESVSVYLKNPDPNQPMATWLPGQHLQIRFNIDGKPVTRRYSICSSPSSGALQLGVKQVENGLVSNFINSQLKVGDLLPVSRPQGHFVLQPDAKKRRTCYFFAAGSGITPILSMITSLLESEPESQAFLLYGNRELKQVMFAGTLRQLQQDYPGRLLVRHSFSQPGWFDASPWRKGRIDAAAVSDFIAENPPTAQDCQYFICGPGEFLPDIQTALQDLDVPDERIHMESFGDTKAQPVVAKNNSLATLRVTLSGQKHKLPVQPGQTLLAAMQKAKIPAPYSCEAGVCGTCQCQLITGKVTMANNLVLDEQAIQAGKILACQSRAETSQLEIAYTNE